MWVVVVSSPPTAPQPGPVGQVARLSETAIAFAGAGRASTETGIAFAGTGRASTETAIAFAGAGRASTETAIAFAGENWVFLARFSLALVLSVSMVAVLGRALVMVVSRWSASAVAVVMAVSQLPRGCVLCAKKFALRGLVVGVSAKKFALRAHNGPKLAFSGVLGELFRGWGVGGACRANYFAPASPSLPPAAARHCLPAPRPGLAGPPVPSTSVTMGLLRYTKPSSAVSPACRSLM